MIVNSHMQFITPDGKIKNGYYIDETLKHNLDWLKEAVKRKWDGVFLITGNEGTAKTTLSQMIGHYLDNDLNIDKICFLGTQLISAINNAKSGDCIILDEAILTMATQDFATDIQQILIKLFTLIRSKGLFIILIIPNPFMLRRYFLVFRTKFLIHCFSPDGLSRGYAKFYSFKRKKQMYFAGYKTWDMNVVRPNFQFRFTDTLGWFIPTIEYEKKKQEAIQTLSENSKNSTQEKYKKHIQAIREKYEKIVSKYKEKENIIDNAWKNKYNKYKEKTDKIIQELKEKNRQLLNTKSSIKIQNLENERDVILSLLFQIFNKDIDSFVKEFSLLETFNMNKNKILKSIDNGQKLIEFYKQNK